MDGKRYKKLQKKGHKNIIAEANVRNVDQLLVHIIHLGGVVHAK